MSMNLDESITSLAKSYESSRLDELMTYLDQVDASSTQPASFSTIASPLASSDLAGDVLSGVKIKMDKLKRECADKSTVISQLQHELEQERTKQKAQLKRLYVFFGPCFVLTSIDVQPKSSN